MRFRYEPTQYFIARARALRHEYQKEKLKKALAKIVSLDNPRDLGAPYLSAWGYSMGGRCIIQAHIDDENFIVYFTTFSF